MESKPWLPIQALGKSIDCNSDKWTISFEWDKKIHEKMTYLVKVTFVIAHRQTRKVEEEEQRVICFTFFTW